MLWIAISSGQPGQAFQPDDLTSFMRGWRSIAPFFAVVFAAGFTYFSISLSRPLKTSWLNPLTLSVAYGGVGLIALVESVDASVALYWNALYLSVPLVLMAISADDNGLQHLARILNSTWLIMVVTSLSLFVIGLAYLNFADSLAEPYKFLECNSAGWHDWTGGKLRDTGVGRYAAIAALLALSGLWHPRLRGIWIVVLIVSVTLLLFTGARGSMGGFCLGAIPTVLLHSGKKGVAVGTAVAAVLLPVFLITGAHETFLNNCVFRTNSSTPAPNPAPEAVYASVPTLNLDGMEIETGAPETKFTEASIETTPPSNSDTIDIESDSIDIESDSINIESDSINIESDSINIESDSINIESDSIDIEHEPLYGHTFLEFTGRTTVWAEGMELFKTSPVIGKGFHADRLVLNTHMHNGFVHSMVQTGILGTLAYLGAALFGWLLFFKTIKNLNSLPLYHKHLVIQSGAVLAFMTFRAFPESTGAFFGVDWLILAPLLIYLYLVHSRPFA